MYGRAYLACGHCLSKVALKAYLPTVESLMTAFSREMQPSKYGRDSLSVVISLTKESVKYGKTDN